MARGRPTKSAAGKFAAAKAATKAAAKAATQAAKPRPAGPKARKEWHPEGVERAFSWFPGHMRRAQERLGEELKQSDMVLELRDARLPVRSANPELTRLAGPRPRLVVFNKASLADPGASAAWQQRLDTERVPHLFVDADSRQGLAALLAHVAALTQPGQERLRARGIRPPPPRVVIVGLPNVGKSTLINRLAQRQRAKTAPNPGVTRHLTWIAVEDKFLLMDSPGIMLPRIENERDALALTWIGAIKDSILGAQRVAEMLLAHLQSHGVALPPHTWLPQDWLRVGAEALLDQIGRARGFLAAGNTVDAIKAAQFVLEQYRMGHLGKLTFDAPSA